MDVVGLTIYLKTSKRRGHIDVSIIENVSQLFLLQIANFLLKSFYFIINVGKLSFLALQLEAKSIEQVLHCDGLVAKSLLSVIPHFSASVLNLQTLLLQISIFSCLTFEKMALFSQVGALFIKLIELLEHRKWNSV